VRASWLVPVKLLSARRAYHVALMVVVIAIGGAVLQDGRTAAAVRPGEREARTLRSLGLTAPGRIAFTEPGGCELRVVDLGSGRFVDVPRRAGNCELWAPRVGTRVAYGVPDDCGCAIRHFRVRDLEHPRASFGDYKTVLPVTWSADGSRLAWCDTPRSGFELSSGRRPRRLDHCPRAYDPRGVIASVNDRGQIVVGGRPLLRVRGFVQELAWGTDGSLALLVDARVERYKGGRLVGSTNVRSSTLAHPVTIGLSPDNCAALSVGGALVRLIDLGCFRGRAPQTFNGVYADWSPDGKWIAVAEPDAVVFYRVVGSPVAVRWNVAVGVLAWLGR
jgi:hypothetical protein